MRSHVSFGVVECGGGVAPLSAGIPRPICEVGGGMVGARAGSGFPEL